MQAFSLDRCPLRGEHNRENLMAAVLAGLALHVRPSVIQQTLDGFRGLPHRLEFVGRIRDVDFYDDSKATNVDAALRSVTSFETPVVLIGVCVHVGVRITVAVTVSITVSVSEEEITRPSSGRPRDE